MVAATRKTIARVKEPAEARAGSQPQRPTCCAPGKVFNREETQNDDQPEDNNFGARPGDRVGARRARAARASAGRRHPHRHHAAHGRRERPQVWPDGEGRARGRQRVGRHQRQEDRGDPARRRVQARQGHRQRQPLHPPAQGASGDGLDLQLGFAADGRHHRQGRGAADRAALDQHQHHQEGQRVGVPHLGVGAVLRFGARQVSVRERRQEGRLSLHDGRRRHRLRQGLHGLHEEDLQRRSGLRSADAGDGSRFPRASAQDQVARRRRARDRRTARRDRAHLAAVLSRSASPRRCAAWRLPLPPTRRCPSSRATRPSA